MDFNSVKVTKLEVGSGEAANGKDFVDSESTNALQEEGEILADVGSNDKPNEEQQSEDKTTKSHPEQKDVASNSDASKVKEEYEGSEGEIGNETIFIHISSLAIKCVYIYINKMAELSKCVVELHI